MAVPKIGNPNAEQWVALLASNCCDDQIGLIQRAHKAVEAVGALNQL